MTIGYEYPSGYHTRRHGPGGYTSYESYRHWLRDEFIFRCVYCLRREAWGPPTAFHIDHANPLKVNPEGECDYENLLYACGACNEAKKAILNFPDPCRVAFRECLEVLPDGHVKARNKVGERLIETLRLDNEKNVGWRRDWMGTLSLLKEQRPDLYRAYMGFPKDLPDLRTKKAPTNARPKSVEACFFVLREQGKLPDTY